MTPLMQNIIEHANDRMVTNRKIVQGEFVPGDKDGKITRDTLRRLSDGGLIDRVEIKPNGFVTSTCPVYMPNEYGCRMLFAETGKPAHLLSGTPPKRLYTHFDHFLKVNRFLGEFTKGVKASKVELVRTVLEHQWVDPEKQTKMLTVLGKGTGGGNVVCAPDLATVICHEKITRVLFWEFETGSDGSPSRVAAKKEKGYQRFFGGAWKELFPCAERVSVIAVCPNAGWRDTLRKALGDKEAKEMWLCVAVDEIRRDGKFVLEEAVFHPVVGKPRPLVPPQAEAGGGSQPGSSQVPQLQSAQ